MEKVSRRKFVATAWPEPLLFFVHLRSPLRTKGLAPVPLSPDRLTTK